MNHKRKNAYDSYRLSLEKLKLLSRVLVVLAQLISFLTTLVSQLGR